MWISSDRFDQLYPSDSTPVGIGNYGTVYRSGDVVVKVVSRVPDELTLDAVIKEIDLYTKIDHRCVPKLYHWTFDQNQCRMALARGTDIVQAYRSGLISIKQMWGDLLSVSILLQALGVSHNDIKPENMIYSEGHLQLIDFGVASDIVNGYILNPMYAQAYRDPEIQLGTPVSIKVEQYAIGLSLTQITGQSFPDMIQHPIESRYSSAELIQKYNLPFTPGRVLRYPLLPLIQDPYTSILISFMEQKSNSQRSIDNALQIYSRIQILNLDPELKIRGSIVLSQYVCGEPTYYLYRDLGNHSLIRDVCILILISLNGVTSYTT